jgi:hypothetical protein
MTATVSATEIRLSSSGSIAVDSGTVIGSMAIVFAIVAVFPPPPITMTTTIGMNPTLTVATAMVGVRELCWALADVGTVIAAVGADMVEVMVDTAAVAAVVIDIGWQ